MARIRTRVTMGLTVSNFFFTFFLGLCYHLSKMEIFLICLLPSFLEAVEDHFCFLAEK